MPRAYFKREKKKAYQWKGMEGKKGKKNKQQTFKMLFDKDDFSRVNNNVLHL